MVSKDIIADIYALEQKYPNPVNPSTMIEFLVPEDVNNKILTIYNGLRSESCSTSKFHDGS
jgi:hypothetical protein